MMQISSKRDDRAYGSTVSRDSRHIAFTVGQRLGIMDLVTGQDRQVLRATTGNPTDALISPDGKSVVYHVSRRVMIVGADGSNDRELVGVRPEQNSTGGLQPPLALDWSPDGRYVLVTFNGPRSAPRSAGPAVSPPQPGEIRASLAMFAPIPGELRLISAADGSVAQSFLDRGNPVGRFSPDGRYIALAGTGGLRVLTRATGEVHPLTENGNAPHWTPDGGRIVFTRERRIFFTAFPTSGDLWSIKISDGRPVGGPEFVKSDVGTMLGATGDGGYLFRTSNATRDIYSVDIDPTTGRRTGPPKQVTSRDDSRSPSWSPDGTQLAFFIFGDPRTSSFSPEASRLVVQNTATPDSLQSLLAHPSLQFAPRAEMSPQWFPDSRTLLVARAGELARVDVLSRQFTPILPSVRIPIDISSVYPTSVRLSHDGRFVYYFVNGPGGPTIPIRRIGKLDLQTGSMSTVVDLDAKGLSSLAISRDDRQLAFIADTSTAENPIGRSVMITPSSGGEARVIHRTREVGISDVTWSIDGRRLFYSTRATRYLPDAVVDVGGDIWTVGSDGADPRPLGVGLSDEYYLNMHPNGRQLVFMEENLRNELWVLRLPAALTNR